MAKKKYKKIWASREEYDAREARLDERMRVSRAIAEKAWAELVEKKPELKNL